MFKMLTNQKTVIGIAIGIAAVVAYGYWRQGAVKKAV